MLYALPVLLGFLVPSACELFSTRIWIQMMLYTTFCSVVPIKTSSGICLVVFLCGEIKVAATTLLYTYT